MLNNRFVKETDGTFCPYSFTFTLSMFVHIFWKLADTDEGEETERYHRKSWGGGFSVANNSSETILGHEAYTWWVGKKLKASIQCFFAWEKGQAAFFLRGTLSQPPPHHACPPVDVCLNNHANVEETNVWWYVVWKRLIYASPFVY